MAVGSIEGVSPSKAGSIRMRDHLSRWAVSKDLLYLDLAAFLVRILVLRLVFSSWLALVMVIGAGCSNSTTSTQSAKSTRSAGTDSSAGMKSKSDGPAALQENSSNLAKELEALGVKLRINAKSKQIESADCSSVEVSDHLADRLSQIDSLVQLTLRQSSMTEQGWTSLSRLNSLQHLDLRECPVNNAQLTRVAGSMSQLRSLRLSGKAGNCLVDDSGMPFLPRLTNLKLLSLDGVKVGDVGLKDIALCSKLAELYLADTLITDVTLGQIALLKEVKKLRLAQTAVSAAGLRQVAGLLLEELDVSQCASIDDSSCAEIGKMSSLKRLNLWSDPVSDQGLRQLVPLTQLQWLNLDNTRITDAGLPALKDFSKLGFLHLGSTVVSDEGLPNLTALSGLKQLVVTRTKVTQAGVDTLQKLVPAVDIQLQYEAGR